MELKLLLQIIMKCFVFFRFSIIRFERKKKENCKLLVKKVKNINLFGIYLMYF